jgi:transcriptional regulator with PAS, ATPase and Fis domain
VNFSDTRKARSPAPWRNGLAVSNRRNGGTIFLDEIGEMSPKLQAKLLQVTQDGRFQRVGSNTEIQTNARILAATNRNLEEEVKTGRFREDLFYRLNVGGTERPSVARAPRRHPALASLFITEFTQVAPGSLRPSQIVWSDIRGLATCANCATPWNGRHCFHKAN